VCYQLAGVCFLVVTACHFALLVRDLQYIYANSKKKKNFAAKTTVIGLFLLFGAFSIDKLC
jgi:hypothetical protein